MFVPGATTLSIRSIVLELSFVMTAATLSVSCFSERAPMIGDVIPG
jgi:hypothetical protein